MMDLLDLGVRVSVAYLGPLLWWLLTAVMPLAALNWWLLAWMVVDSPDPEDVARFIAAMICLIVIEAPLASIFLTSFIGQAVFLARPRAREVFQSVATAAWRIVWCLVLCRGIGLAWLLAFYIPREEGYSGQEFFLLMLAFVVLAVRAFRPYLNEIILLERNPLRTDNPHKLTIRQRNSALHSPSSSDLFGRWMAAACVAVPLTLSTILSIWFCFGMLLFDWTWGPVMIQVCVPAAMWLVVGYFAVVRFLTYLDLRIRREGWEVDLIMAGAAARLGEA